MRFHALFAAPALAIAALSACALPAAPAGIPAAPVEVADKTVLDERAAFGVELAYEAFRSAVELGVDAGLIKGARATALANLDSRAYQALLVARAAYDAGNAESYSSALSNAREAISDGIALIKGRSS